MPNIPPSWPIATWIPTPVRNPMRTVRDRKLAMKPSRSSRATTRSTPHMSAASEASSTYSGDCATAPIATSPVAMIAAVAEAAPTGAGGGAPRAGGGGGGRGEEYRKKDDRHDDRVEARDHRGAGDLRV